MPPAPKTTIYTAKNLLPVSAPGIPDGALLVAEGRIVAVDKRRDMVAANPGIDVVDFGDKVILPPMVNAHTHLELTHYPDWSAKTESLGKPTGFADWVLQLIRVRRRIDMEQWHASLTDGMRQSLQVGTGAIGDILTSLQAGAAYAGTPLLGRVFCEVIGLQPEQVAQRLAQIEAHRAKRGDHRLQWGVSPHAPYTLTKKTLHTVCEWAAERGLALSMHLAETAEEAEFVATQTGPIAEQLYTAAEWPVEVKSGRRVMSPVAWVLDGGSLPPGSLVVHGVHVETIDVERIRDARLAVALCPRSNARFGERRAPVRAYHEHGVPLALGTDSLASAPSLSLWDELAFAWRWFNGQLDPDVWLQIATLGGARALGISERIGTLTVGSEASFQIVQLPQEVSSGELIEALCADGESVVVEALYLAGENVLP